jgi:hypothetical protein
MKPSNARNRAATALLLFLAVSALDAQSPRPSASPAPIISPAASAAPLSSASPGTKDSVLPKGFRSYELGMGMDEVKAILKEDDLLAYSGDADVSLLPSGTGSVIDVPGDSFIKRATFQFIDDKLWAMVFTLDTLKIDHYSVFTAMSAKHGKPGRIDPKESVWEDEKVRVSIERPLTVKYLDLEALAALNEKAGTEKAYREILRDEFLNLF